MLKIEIQTDANGKIPFSESLMLTRLLEANNSIGFEAKVENEEDKVHKKKVKKET
jgi:hypothetical protein